MNKEMDLKAWRHVIVLSQVGVEVLIDRMDKTLKKAIYKNDIALQKKLNYDIGLLKEIEMNKSVV